MIPCIVCGEVLEQAIPEKPESFQPYKGLMCTTSGNYGSTIYDPVGPRSLIFIVCDSCMADVAERGWVKQMTSVPRTENHYETWEP
jgi:hypothetical protein